MMSNGARVSVLCLAVAMTVAGVQAAPEDEAAPGPVVVLDTAGVWRMFHVLRPPEIALDSGVMPAVFAQYWLRAESPPPSGGWTEPEFDDSAWLRGPALMSCKTPFLARACFRGRFHVTDPAEVGRLTLAVGYKGGVIVYVNGKEVRRAHLPASGRPRLAEAYPLETFVGQDGVLLAPQGSMVMVGGKLRQAGKPTDEALRRMALQRRELADVPIPPGLLRKGVNVLAVEVVRAPYHNIVDEQKTGDSAKPIYDMQWNTCELLAVRLTAGEPGGLEPNAVRPEGFQVWNSSILRNDFELDFGDRCEELRPIAMTGVVGGVFSGKVVAGSAEPIKGLKAEVSELKGPAGTIPTSALRVRYAVPGGTEYGMGEPVFGFGSIEARSPLWASALGVLHDAPPDEVAVRGAGSRPAAGLDAVPGAVAAIWVTVSVPGDAAPGTYEGKLHIAAQGQRPVAVPVRLDVLDWRLPDPYEFRTWIELFQSPDTLELEYGVEPWSDRHFELIARSMRLLREVGSGVVYVPLICETNYGNAESMVRWVPKNGGRYAFDFAVMDRYLDVAEKNLGKPKIVCFIVWDVYLLPKDEGSRAARYVNRAGDRVVQPAVSVLDPATEKVETKFVHNFADPAGKPQWRALFGELHKRMRQRGLEQAMMIGMMSDGKPSKDEIAFWREVTGDLPWVSHSHWPTSNPHYFGKVLGSGFKTGYMTSVYDVRFPDDPANGRTYGWKNPLLHAQNMRLPSGLDKYPGTFWRGMGEINIAGGQRGFGRLGGDCWHAVRDKRGQRAGRAYERYPQSAWMNLDLRCSLLAPGPDGAVATTRFEILREGVQECEARIFIEQALTDNALRARLGKDLARRCQELLDERTLCIQRGVADFEVNCYGYCTPWNWMWQTGIAGHAWFQSSGWQDRSRRLYVLAGEVADRLGER